MLTVVGCILIGLLGVLCGLYFGSRSSTRQSFSQSKKRTAVRWNAYRAREEASAELQQQLIDMVGGNRQEAEKLVSRARFGHYDRSESYYWRRAIQELEQQRQQKPRD
ncbi:hypothetical protein [Altericista sp. CCNU0014]|uniref:hypothetical protein n=1 Tax=Altericista sp. CCNU0014 TaxID=3082949 RepID=UPI00384A9F01